MKTLLLLAVASLPSAPSALEWVGSAGVIYNRGDDWFVSGAHSTQPHLDLSLKFDVNGYVSNPGIFAYSGGIAYQRVSDQLDGRSTGLTNSLTYKVDLGLFRHQLSAVTLTGYASRFDTRVENSPAYVGVGEHTDQRVGGTLRLVPRSLPTTLTVGYARQDTTDDIPGLALHDVSKDVLNATFSHTPGPFGLRAQYRGEWSDGSWIGDRNRNFGVTVSEQSTLSRNSRLFLNDAYYERTPTATGVGAFGVTTNVFSGGYLRGSERGDQTLAQYSFHRGVSTLATGVSESQGQSLRLEQDLPLSRGETRSWIHFLGNGALTTQRSPTQSLESSGETVGAQYWHRKNAEGVLWEFGAGPLAALLQLPGEPGRVGYGGMATARLNRGWGANQLGAFYSVDYGSDVYGRRGWTLAQQAGANLAGPAGSRGRFRANFVLTTRRGWSPVLGDDSVRNIQLTAGYLQGRYSLDADAGLQSGLAGNAPPEFLGDGLFLPAGFNSHQVFARVTASAVLFPGLTSRLQLRATESVIPGQPDVSVVEGIGALVYRYAAFDVSIEDRVTVTATSAGNARQNLLMVRVARTIGSSY